MKTIVSRLCAERAVQGNAALWILKRYLLKKLPIRYHENFAVSMVFCVCNSL